MTKVLIGLHDVQVEVDRDLKRFEHLVEHFTMLARRDHDRFELVGPVSSADDDRSQLDDFRPCSHDD